MASVKIMLSYNNLEAAFVKGFEILVFRTPYPSGWVPVSMLYNDLPFTAIPQFLN